jgi:hypothetical protein
MNLRGELLSPCSLRLLTPALSSFGEEREKAAATFAVQGFNARIVRGILSPTSWRRGRRRRARLRFMAPMRIRRVRWRLPKYF